MAYTHFTLKETHYIETRHKLKDAALQEIFMAVLPFIGLPLMGLTLVIIFPDIAMWLPGLGKESCGEEYAARFRSAGFSHL